MTENVLSLMELLSPIISNGATDEILHAKYRITLEHVFDIDPLVSDQLSDLDLYWLPEGYAEALHLNFFDLVTIGDGSYRDSVRLIVDHLFVRKTPLSKAFFEHVTKEYKTPYAYMKRIRGIVRLRRSEEEAMISRLAEEYGRRRNRL